MGLADGRRRERKMRVRLAGVVAIGVVATVALTACSSSKKTPSGSNNSSASGSGKVGVILPDETSSPRYITYDKPLLQQAFSAAGITADIQNAQGDKTKFATIADSMIQEGVQVLIVDGLDSPSAAAVQQKAKAAGIKTIDYDRLTLGGSADYYVSFDNTAVGKLQGEGLVACLDGKTDAKIIELNGSPDDNNATLFKNGYDSVLTPKYASGWKKAGDQSVPGWDKDKAVTIFQQMFTAAGGKVDGVLAANDTLGNAAITILKQNGLKIPVTGQDASIQGLQNILAGEQCMTVFKDVKLEAQAAAKLAITLIKGQDAASAGATATAKDTTGNRDVPSVLLTPVAITKANVKTVTDTGEVKVADVCKGYAAACKAAGIS
jgi:D-xylose transport system substrate-binding protein